VTDNDKPPGLSMPVATPGTYSTGRLSRLACRDQSTTHYRCAHAVRLAAFPVLRPQIRCVRKRSHRRLSRERRGDALTKVGCRRRHPTGLGSVEALGPPL
jgi:hypothetical protein